MEYDVLFLEPGEVYPLDYLEIRLLQYPLRLSEPGIVISIG